MNDLMIHQSGDLTIHPAASVAVSARLLEYTEAARGAFARNTERAIRADLAGFARWCEAAGVESCPASPAVVVAYLDEMAAERKPTTLRRYAASIAHLHRAAGVENPVATEPVRLALRRIARAAAERASAEARPVKAQAEGITDRDVGRILATSGDTLRDLRDVALLLVGRDLLARREELVALQAADVTESPAGDGSATATIRRSKTDAAGEGADQYVSPEAFAALRRWCKAAGISTGPVFRSMKKGGRVTDRALGAGEVPGILKRLARRAGLPDDRVVRIAGHSLRVGMAADLVAGGADLPALMQAGRWRSPAMPAMYARKLLAGRGAVAQYHARRRA